MVRELPYDAEITEEPTCSECGRVCNRTEVVWTGDANSYEGFELWCYCEHCGVETFHKINKQKNRV